MCWCYDTVTMTAVPLHFYLDTVSGLPAYRQLMEQIRTYLAAGQLAAGDQLPSIRDLARTLQVNPATVVKAYTELEHEGVIERQQGRGVFVTTFGGQLPQEKLEQELRRAVRAVAVRARQMGADTRLVERLLEEELAALERRGAPGDGAA